MKFQNCKYVIFDLDGTITDPKEGITASVVYALRALGYDAPEKSALEWFIGPPLLQSFMEYTGCKESEGKRLIEKYRERYKTIGVHENTLYPGMEALLSTLNNTSKILAVASSKPTIFVRQILDDFQLTKYFTVIEGSDLGGNHVEKEDVLGSALKKLGRDAVMVGDRKFDILAARKFGLKTIGAGYGYAQGDELIKAGADVIANSPAEIADFLHSYKNNP